MVGRGRQTLPNGTEGLLRDGTGPRVGDCLPFGVDRLRPRDHEHAECQYLPSTLQVKFERIHST